MERYNIYYTKYNILARDYVPYVKVVYTEDIFHEVGKLVCTSIEKIKSISYTKPKATLEACEQYWTEEGYEQISNTLWRLCKQADSEDDIVE